MNGQTSRYQQIRSGETQKGRGTGLGLSLSLHIVCLHQGVIRVTTETKVGSSFEIFLPFSGNDNCSNDPEKTSVSPTVKCKIKTIAIVDDQSSIRQLLNSCLKRLGYDVKSIIHF